MPVVALVAAMLSFAAGCDDDQCVDLDEDGFGVGGACEASDCDDGDARHHADCLSCSDPDNDGYGVGCDLGADCAPSNALHWADCGNCTDGDLDGRGTACDLGDDCDDIDPDLWGACGGACTDADGDGSFTGCDAYENRTGPDCNDADPDNYTRCEFCADGDGDGRFSNCDKYVANMGPDCNDANANVWSACATCRDLDGDTYFTACDAYTGINGPDCNDGNALHWNDCSACTDADNDGRGTSCDLGADCSDTNRDVWVSCGTCADADSDSRWAGCDAYFQRLGPDCNDADAASWSSCSTCVDVDTDGYWRGCDTYPVAKPGPDCNDADVNNHISCGTCRDNDTDLNFVGCDRYTTIDGPDCSDADRNNWGACSTCVDADGDARYTACDAYSTIGGPDCDDASNEHWSDCGLCVDNDGDGRGTSCDLGTDCNDNSDFHWSDCQTCTDGDGDGWGVGVCDTGTGDCDDANPDRNPGEADATVNGVDENCNGIDGPSFADNFDDGVYAPQWTVSSGDTQIQTIYQVSGLYALNVGGGIGDVQSTFFDTSSCMSVVWRYQGKRGPEAPDSGENLLFQYWNGTSWITFDTWLGTSTTDAGFALRQGTIAAVDARHPSFRVRFLTSGGTGVSFDDYFIDDVAVGCAADSDGDLTLDPFDCAPADNAHWSDCGACIDGDGDDYGTACNLGVDCNDADPAVNPAATDASTDGTDQNCDGHDGPVFTQTYSSSAAVPITDATGEAFSCGATNANTSEIVVTDAGTLFDVDVTLDVTHPNTSHLDVWLLYNDGVTTPTCVQLTTDNGFSSNYTNTVFSDEALTAITAGTAPFTGSFRPESVLSALDTRALAGTYTLYINDDTSLSTGTLTSWSLTIRYY